MILYLFILELDSPINVTCETKKDGIMHRKFIATFDYIDHTSEQ